MLASRIAAVSNYALSRPRLIKFIAVGGIASLFQLFSLYVIASAGLPAAWANVPAFTLATQLNFTLSYQITWHDRKPQRPTTAYVVGRLLAFNVMAAVTFVANESVFVVTDYFVHYLLAGVLGITAATAMNFIISALVIFRAPSLPERPVRLASTGRTPLSP